MSFEQCCCLNKDDCLGLSTESEVQAQYVVWVWWNALHSFTASPIYSAPLYSSAPLQVDLDQASSHHPLLCCVVLCLASFLSAFSLEHTCSVSFIPSKALLKMHISYDIATSDFPPLWYRCLPYDSLYLCSFPYFLHLICGSDSVIYNPLA